VKVIRRASLIGVLILFSMMRVEAQEDENWKKEIERKIEVLTQELEKSNLGEVAEPIYEKKYGFAPAAAKVYHVNRGVSIGGYGEMVLQDWDSEQDNGAPANRKSELDFLRAVLYVGYKFTDKILFNSEIEFEHASTSGGSSPRGEVSLEFAYLDFMISQPVGIRAGLLLMPTGIVNELHEPTLYHGARRPNVENDILPTTWRENGAGLFGEAGPFRYRTYVVTGLQAVDESTTSSNGIDGFKSSGIRNGRSKGAKSIAEDWAWVGRVDFEGIPGTVIGASVYSGNAGQDFTDSAGTTLDVSVDIWDVHGLCEYRGLEFRGLYAKTRINDVARLNVKNGLGASGTNSIGEQQFGGYLELAYDVLSLIESKHYLAPFFRYERIDTQERVPAGYSKNPANSRTEYTYGLTYKPHPNTVIKADFTDVDNQAGTGIDKINAAVGYLF